MTRTFGAVVAWLAVTGCGPKMVETTPDGPEAAIGLTPERVARGAYLVNGIGACGGCHNGRPAEGDYLQVYDQFTSVLGGTRANLGEGMYVYVPNITSGQDGVGTWSDAQVIDAIRNGIRPDGERLFGIMPFMTYQYMSDEDARSIVAYLRSTAPVAGRLDPKDDQVPLIAKIAFNKKHDGVATVPEPDRSDKVKYGEYLAQLGHCGECHSAGINPREIGDEKWLAGSAVPFPMQTGKYPAPNLTPDLETGLGKYSAEQIRAALLEGKLLNGEPMQPPMAFFVPFYRNISDEDLDALVAYLQSLPPVKGYGIPRKLNEKGVAFAAESEKRLAAWKASQAAEATASGSSSASELGVGEPLPPAGPASTAEPPAAPEAPAAEPAAEPPPTPGTGTPGGP